jgi:hypothetical protein
MRKAPHFNSAPKIPTVSGGLTADSPLVDGSHFLHGDVARNNTDQGGSSDMVVPGRGQVHDPIRLQTVPDGAKVDDPKPSLRRRPANFKRTNGLT